MTRDRARVQCTWIPRDENPFCFPLPHRVRREGAAHRLIHTDVRRALNRKRTHRTGRRNRLSHDAGVCRANELQPGQHVYFVKSLRTRQH